MRTLGILAHPGVSRKDAVELAELAEVEGLGIVGTGDNGYAEAFGQLGAFAARTSRVELISCAINWTRTPVTTDWAMFSGPRRYPAAVYREQMERISRCFGPLCAGAGGRVRL